MEFPYSEKVLQHFRNPRNVGEIENPDGKATEGSPACGDMVSVTLKIDEKTRRIKDIKFKSYGCASNIATGSIITEMARGKTIQEAKKISWKEAADALGGLPPLKTHCSVLAVEGLREAIRNYEEKQGLVREKKPTTVKTLRRRLKHIINPLSGLDIVKTDLVQDMSISNGVVSIVIGLPPDHQFAANIREEIKEKIEPIRDVKEVKLEFIG